ncbi:MAG: DUF1700 domain-containing protein [Ruminococcaceae bacterium]|nr:DUF1700 domain-containing protein [Oscillospiraceae bacterium]
MTKKEFLCELEEALSGIPKEEREERLNFYGEMIDDRIEEGISEEEAVSDLGTVDEVVWQIIDEIPLTKIAKEKMKPKRKLKAWEIVLLAVGSPLWLSLLIAAFAVIFSLYVSLWAVAVSLWAAFGSVVASGFGGIIGGGILVVGGEVPSGIALIAAALVCLGLSVFFFFGCKALTKGSVVLAKKTVLGIKKAFVKKEEA